MKMMICAVVLLMAPAIGAADDVILPLHSLHQATKDGDFELVKKLIFEDKVPLDLRDADGNTALYLAVEGKHVRIAQYLVLCGADICAVNSAGITPLAMSMRGCRKEISCILWEYDHLKLTELDRLEAAMTLGDPDAFEYLFTCSKSVLDKGRYFYWAFNHGCLNVVNLLITSGVDVNCTNRDGNTPLHLAAQKGYQEVVQLLIEKGVDVNCTNRDGNTPLHLAAMLLNPYSSRTIITYLLEAGGKIDCISRNGNTVLDVVLSYYNVELAEYLIQRCGLNNELMRFPKSIQSIEMFNLAIKFRSSKVSALSLFGLIGWSVSIFKDALSVYGPVGLVDNEGKTVLHYLASEKGMNIANIELVLANGARTDIYDNEGHLPVYYAVECGSCGVVELLLTGNEGCVQELLQRAVLRNRADILELLCTKAADLSQEQIGRNLLRFAVFKGYTECVQTLLSHDVAFDQDIVDLARKKGFAEVIELLWQAYERQLMKSLSGN